MPDTVYHDDHRWVVASHVPLTAKAARQADRLGSHRLRGVKIEVVDVRCTRCGRPHDDVHDRPCPSGGDHDWRGDVNVPLTGDQVVHARIHGWALVNGARVGVLEVMCSRCRRTYDDVADEVCESGVHLIGGPTGTRRKRKGRGGGATLGAGPA